MTVVQELATRPDFIADVQKGKSMSAMEKGIEGWGVSRDTIRNAYRLAKQKIEASKASGEMVDGFLGSSNPAEQDRINNAQDGCNHSEVVVLPVPTNALVGHILNEIPLYDNPDHSVPTSDGSKAGSRTLIDHITDIFPMAGVGSDGVIYSEITHGHTHDVTLAEALAICAQMDPDAPQMIGAPIIKGFNVDGSTVTEVVITPSFSVPACAESEITMHPDGTISGPVGIGSEYENIASSVVAITLHDFASGLNSAVNGNVQEPNLDDEEEPVQPLVKSGQEVAVAGDYSQASTWLSPSVPLPSQIALLNLAEHTMDAIEVKLPTMSTDDISMVAKQAHEGGARNYWLRAACAYYYKTKIAIKTQGKKDKSGTGQWATLAELGRTLGVDGSTLSADADIYETFVVKPREANSDVVARGGIPMGREHLRAAMAAPDPISALKMAQDKTAAGQYTVKDMRDDVQALKEAAATNNTIAGAGGSEGADDGGAEGDDLTQELLDKGWCRIHVREVDKQEFWEYIRQSGREMEDVFAQMVAFLKEFRPGYQAVLLSDEAMATLDCLVRNDRHVTGNRNMTVSDYIERAVNMQKVSLGLGGDDPTISDAAHDDGPGESAMNDYEGAEDTEDDEGSSVG